MGRWGRIGLDFSVTSLLRHRSEVSTVVVDWLERSSDKPKGATSGQWGSQSVQWAIVDDDCGMAIAEE